MASNISSLQDSMSSSWSLDSEGYSNPSLTRLWKIIKRGDTTRFEEEMAMNL